MAGSVYPKLDEISAHKDNKQGSKGKTIEDQLSNRNKNYRIMILPWPEFTDAYKSNSSTKGGNAIFGKRLTEN